MVSFGNVSPVAGTDDSAVQNAFTILGVVGDDNKFKQRLNELVEIAKEATALRQEAKADREAVEKAHTAATEMLAEAMHLKAEADQKMAAAEELVATSTASASKREAELATSREEHEREILKSKAELNELTGQMFARVDQYKADTEAKAAAREQALNQQQREVQKKEALIDAKAVALADKDKELKTRADKLAAQEIDYTVRLGKLKALIGG